MTAYKRTQPLQSLSQAAQEAKAKRQAVLQRVRAQRAATYKRTAAEWMQDGEIIRTSELKKRYQQGQRHEIGADIDDRLSQSYTR